MPCGRLLFIERCPMTTLCSVGFSHFVSTWCRFLMFFKDLWSLMAWVKPAVLSLVLLQQFVWTKSRQKSSEFARKDWVWMFIDLWCGERDSRNELSVIDRTCPSSTPSPSPAITCRRLAVTLCWRRRSHSLTALSTAAVVRTTALETMGNGLDGQPGKHLGRVGKLQ